MNARTIARWAGTLIPPVAGLVARPRRVDVVISVLLAALASVEFPFMTTPYPGLALAASLLVAAAAAFRRVKPFPVVAIATAVAIGVDAVGAVTDEPVIGTIGGGLAIIVILYSVGRWAPPPTVIIAALLGVGFLPAAGFLNPENDPAWLWYLLEVALTVTVMVVGVLVRSQQVLKIEQARADLAEERDRLANDIHDSVAHHMSAIAVRAEGARQLTDPAQRDEALDAIRQSASTGLADVRHLVSSIRSTKDMPKPLPGLGDLYQLAGESTTPSLDVEVHIDADAETIPAPVTAVAYAIVREALTNVRRHATGATGRRCGPHHRRLPRPDGHRRWLNTDHPTHRPRVRYQGHDRTSEFRGGQPQRRPEPRWRMADRSATPDHGLRQSMTISVMIADDQEMVRTGLRHTIDADPQLQVVGAAEDGRQALDMARQLRPDVCALDIRMPHLTGLDVTRELANDANPPAIVIVTTYDLEEYLFQALEAGAAGFVLKDASAAVINGAIHAAATGEALISPGLTHRLIETYLQRSSRGARGLSRFTPREQDVLRVVCEGMTNDELARSLGLSVSTVKGHITSLMQKTETNSRVNLVIWAYRHTNIRDMP